MDYETQTEEKEEKEKKKRKKKIPDLVPSAIKGENAIVEAVQQLLCPKPSLRDLRTRLGQVPSLALLSLQFLSLSLSINSPLLNLSATSEIASSMEMEVMADFNFDSAGTSPYVSSPSSPQRFGNFFFIGVLSLGTCSKAEK